MNRHFLFLLFAACAPAMPELAPLAPDVGDPEPRTWADAGPVFEKHCVSCHSDEGIAPFSLATYDDAKPWATPSAAATMARTMPPFFVRGDGTCGEFEDNHWLSDDDLRTLQWWADQGAPEGEGYTITPTTRPVLEGPTIDHTTPDFLPEIVGGELAKFDEYRCFQVDLSGEDTFLTGYDVFPGNDAIVHHVIGMPVLLDGLGWDEEQTNAEIIAELDGQDDRVGWPCFSEAGEGVSIESQVISWAPGQDPVTFGDGVGLKLEAGAVMVYQVHYNLADPSTLGQRDQTTIRLQLADEVEREATILLDDGFLGGSSKVKQLEPGTAEQEVYFTLEFGGDIDVLGVLPHMHERGTSMRVDIKGKDGDCLVEVPRWDFNWQHMYLFSEPVETSGRTIFQVWCSYDTTDDDEPVLPGWGTRNEMCLPGMLVSLR